jgi:predicted DNA-binding transcriptional regulator YafY
MFESEESNMQDKYIGRIVDIIYQDKAGTITKRRIRVLVINAGIVRAYDLGKKAPRVFEIDRILAAQPAGKSA